MTTTPAVVSDWSTRFQYDWTSSEGITRLREIISPRVPYEPADFQLKNTARLLNGEKVLCVSATGDGKSALFYLYSLVRPDTLTIVVSPTNALESDMVTNLSKLHIPAMAINADSMTAAGLQVPPRNLWSDAASGRYNIVLLSPETLKTKDFREFVTRADVRKMLALFCVDECHLVVEWGKDFRKEYGNIHEAIPWLVDWIAVVALTATLEPGRQLEAVTSAIGFRRGDYHFEKRDCARHNIDIIIRPIQYAYTTHEYRDLDWLIPSDPDLAANDFPKTLLYCETIELGLRVARYLRHLLPTALYHHRYKVIRHVHSMYDSKCKDESILSLYTSGASRETGIYITTDVLGVGMNVSDFDRVICFPTPSSAASMVQRIGRASRGRDRHGVAYVYIKKSEIEDTLKLLKKTPKSQLDPRLLGAEHSVHPQPLFTPSNSDDKQTPEAGRQSPNKKAPKSVIPHTFTAIPSVCQSLWLVIAAHVQGTCIVRQLNIIYQNPGFDRNCERCSSCKPSPIPSPRPLPAPSTPTMDAVNKPNAKSARLHTDDLAYLVGKIQHAALETRHSLPRPDDSLFITSRAFLPRNYISRITNDFFLITSKDVLEQRLVGWRYWDQYGAALWEALAGLIEHMRVYCKEAEARREAEKKPTKKEKQVREYLQSVGLGNVKRVSLLVTPHTAPAVVVNSDSDAGLHLPIVGDKENIPPLDTSQADFDTSISAPRESISMETTLRASLSPTRRHGRK